MESRSQVQSTDIVGRSLTKNLNSNGLAGVKRGSGMLFARTALSGVASGFLVVLSLAGPDGADLPGFAG
jgi:hypothetical protein